MEFHKLDNIGTFYASTSSKPNPDVFRFAVELSDDINEELLTKALKATVKDFPIFNSALRMGLFWYYLKEEDDIPKVEEENLPVCARLDLYADDVLYRVSYYRNRINLEVSHILSDGRGTMEFFTSLVENYVILRYKLKKVSLTYKATLLEREEDSFDKYYEKTDTPKKDKNKIYNLNDKKLKRNKMRFIEMHMDTKKVIKLSKDNKTTMTVFLTGVLIRSIIKTMKFKDKGQTIRIAIPVDLRGYYYSKTIKNFFGLAFITYKYKGEIPELSEIIESVSEQLKDALDKNNLVKRTNQMYSLVTNVVIRSIPLVIKNVGLRVIDEFIGKNTTSNVSNLGKITFNSEVEKYVKSFAAMTTSEDLQFVVSSFKDDLCISATTRFSKNNVLNYFVQELKSYDIEININTNGA